jgi:hypothetical protein
MKQDNNYMINLLECTNKDLIYSKLIKEIVELIKNNPLDDELESNLLSELYKFTRIGHTPIAIDPRGDTSAKYHALNEIKESIVNNNLEKDSLENLKKLNDMCLDNFLNPLKLQKKHQDFFSQHPGAKF